MRPAILIGLGGTGAMIVNNLYSRLSDNDRSKIATFVFDTDYNDIDKLKSLKTSDNVINTGADQIVSDFINKHPNKNFDYLEMHRSILGKNMSKGASQVRKLSRLGFESVNPGEFIKMQNAISKVLAAAPHGQTVNLYLVSSVCGGTGSGILLQLAFLLKNYIPVTHGRSVFVKSVILMPGIFTDSAKISLHNDEKLRVRANAYAFFKEWKTYTDIFNGTYNHDQNKEFLTLQIGQLGSLNTLTPATLVKNSPVLDPVDIFIGIDSVGYSKAGLVYLENYLAMTEDFLYLDIATNIGSTGESRMDNILTAMKEEGGLNKFSGFGSAKIQYPYHDLLQLAPALLLKNTLRANWLEIDSRYNDELNSYEEKRRKNVVAVKPVLKDFFVKTFDEYAQNGHRENYYKTLKQSMLSFTIDDLGLRTQSLSFGDKFIAKMKAHLDNTIRSLTVKRSNQKIIEFYDSEIVRSLMRIAHDSDNLTDDINYLERLKLAFRNEVDGLAEASYDNMCSRYINFNDPVLMDFSNQKAQDFNLNYYLLGGEQQDGTAPMPLRPLATRYLLYKIHDKLLAELQLLKRVTYTKGTRKETGKLSEITAHLEKYENYDYLPDTPELDQIHKAVEKAGATDQRFFGWFRLTGSKLRKVLEEYRLNVNEERYLLTDYFIYTITYNVLSRLEKMIADLIKYWESFFVYLNVELQDSNNKINLRIQELHQKDQSNEVLGRHILFNNPGIREKFIERQLTTTAFNIGTFEHHITEVLYKHALEGFSKGSGLSHEELLKTDFTDMLLDNLQDMLEETKVFDINVAKAILDEADLAGIKEYREHLRNHLSKLESKAGPFMNPDTNPEGIRTFNCWGIHDDTNEILTKQLSPSDYNSIFGDVAILTSTSSKPDHVQTFHYASPAISKYEIIRSNQIYNIAIENLQQFNPPGGKFQELTLHSVFNLGGLYFKSYYQHKLEIWNDRDVTCHLDKRWDGIRILSDMNDGIAKLFEAETRIAFIRGLILGWFENTQNDDHETTWKFNPKGTKNSKEMWITTRDDTQPAGYTFHHLYEALIDNPLYMLKINGYTDATGQLQEGLFLELHKKDKMAGLTNWLNHTFIKKLKHPIHYEIHPNIKHNILDVCLGLHRENNSHHIIELGKELIKTLISEIKAYHKLVYGMGDQFHVRLRHVIKEILASSYYVNNPNYEKPLRAAWKQLIISELNYRTDISDIEKLFPVMKGNNKKKEASADTKEAGEVFPDEAEGSEINAPKTIKKVKKSPARKKR